MLRARTTYDPGGTFARRKRPSAFAEAASEVPTIASCAVETAAPVRRSITRPVSVPDCAKTATIGTTSNAIARQMTATEPERSAGQERLLACRFHTRIPFGNGR